MHPLGPIKQEIEYIGNGVMGMVQSGSQTVSELMENLANASPYLVASGIAVALMAKYGIKYGEQLLKKM